MAWWILMKLGRHMYLNKCCNSVNSVAMVFSFHGNSAEITILKRHPIFYGLEHSGSNTYLKFFNSNTFIWSLAPYLQWALLDLTCGCHGNQGKFDFQ